MLTSSLMRCGPHKGESRDSLMFSMLFCFPTCDFWMHGFQLGKMTADDCKTAAEMVGVFGGRGRIQEGGGYI